MTLDYLVNACVESAPDIGYPATGKRRLIMMYLRECPKCNGDLNAEEDIHGKYVSCTIRLSKGCVVGGLEYVGWKDFRD